MGVAAYTPAEVLKCKAQLTKDSTVSYRQMIPQIIETEGYRGLYRGLLATCIRDIPGYGVYFYSYEVFKQLFYRIDSGERGKKPEQSRQVVLDLMAGGMAGSFSWLVGYPLDIVKTIVQASTTKEAPTIRQVLATGYREQGLKYFFRGLTPTIVRAFPVNAATLASFDHLKQWIRHDHKHRDDVIEKPML